MEETGLSRALIWKGHYAWLTLVQRVAREVILVAHMRQDVVSPRLETMQRRLARSSA